MPAAWQYDLLSSPITSLSRNHWSFAVVPERMTSHRDFSPWASRSANDTFESPTAACTPSQVTNFFMYVVPATASDFQVPASRGAICVARFKPGGAEQ